MKIFWTSNFNFLILYQTIHSMFNWCGKWRFRLVLIEWITHFGHEGELHGPGARLTNHCNQIHMIRDDWISSIRLITILRVQPIHRSLDIRGTFKPPNTFPVIGLLSLGYLFWIFIVFLFSCSFMVHIRPVSHHARHTSILPDLWTFGFPSLFLILRSRWI